MGIRTARASEAITAEAKRPRRRRVARGATAATGAIAMMLACASVAWACTWEAADTVAVPWDPGNATGCPHLYPLMPNNAPPVFKQGCPIKAHAFGVFVGIEADWRVHEVAETANSLAMTAASGASVDDPRTTDPHDQFPASHAGSCGNKGVSGDGSGSALSSLATGGQAISGVYSNGTTIPPNTLVNNPLAWADATLNSRTGLQMICFASNTQASETIPLTILVSQ